MGAHQKVEHHYMVIRLKRPVFGSRFDSAAGDVRTFRWRKDTAPRVVDAARQRQAIDWGGATVQPDGYEVLADAVGYQTLKAQLAHMGVSTY